MDAGTRDTVDKTLQRLAQDGQICRIDRGLYHKPGINKLTGKPTGPDYREVINALARRDQTRMLVDGMTAANDLGLTDAIPGQVIVHTDARRKPLHLDKLNITFRPSASSKLYWAGRPAMRVVQALHWLRDMLPSNHDRIMSRLKSILNDPKQGSAIRADLRSGLPTLPIWMQRFVRELLQSFDKKDGQRVSRHYYDVHQLLHSTIAETALKDQALGLDCVRHARMFFNRPDLDLDHAEPGSLALTPSAAMVEMLRRD